jgi:hypothetical protein
MSVLTNAIFDTEGVSLLSQATKAVSATKIKNRMRIIKVANNDRLAKLRKELISK